MNQVLEGPVAGSTPTREWAVRFSVDRDEDGDALLDCLLGWAEENGLLIGGSTGPREFDFVLAHEDGRVLDAISPVALTEYASGFATGRGFELNGLTYRPCEAAEC